MATYIIGAIVFGIIALNVIHVFKKSKKGGSCCGCDGCPSASKCHK
ncbi:MAG: FeoB-associated Cys-rich membrane protein [Clostridiaceae bacterium]|nr:FeoB-associated Cys-rich membrane protein [Clostridiaceae bacterium]